MFPIQQHGCSYCLQLLFSSTAANAQWRRFKHLEKSQQQRLGLGMPFRRKAVLSLSLQRAFLQANPSGKQRQNLETEKQSGFGNHKAASHASGEGSRKVGLQGCYWRGSALLLHPSRHSRCPTRRDRSKHAVPCVSAKGNNSQIKPADFSQHPLLTPRISGCW